MTDNNVIRDAVEGLRAAQRQIDGLFDTAAEAVGRVRFELASQLADIDTDIAERILNSCDTKPSEAFLEDQRHRFQNAVEGEANALEERVTGAVNDATARAMSTKKGALSNELGEKRQSPAEGEQYKHDRRRVGEVVERFADAVGALANQSVRPSDQAGGPPAGAAPTPETPSPPALGRRFEIVLHDDRVPPPTSVEQASTVVVHNDRTARGPPSQESATPDFAGAMVHTVAGVVLAWKAWRKS